MSESAIEMLPEKLFPPSTDVVLRSVFFRSHADWQRSAPIDLVLEPGERIVNVETVPPNPSIGCGTRVWISNERKRSDS